MSRVAERFRQGTPRARPAVQFRCSLSRLSPQINENHYHRHSCDYRPKPQTINASHGILYPSMVYINIMQRTVSLGPRSRGAMPFPDRLAIATPLRPWRFFAPRPVETWPLVLVCDRKYKRP